MSPPKKAQVQPAKGSPPQSQNTTGRIVNKTKPAPKGAPTNRRAANYDDEFHEYLDSVKTPEQVKQQWGEVQKAKAAAEAAGDRAGAVAANDALAGLQQKANGMGMSVKDLPNVGPSPQQAMAAGAAWESASDAFGKVLTTRAVKFITDVLAKRQAEAQAKAQTEAQAKAQAEAQAKAQAETQARAAKSTSGGYTPGKGRNANGKCGEWQARRDLESQGYEVIDVQNKSGHGIDVVGRDPKTGNVRVLEVKTTQTDVAPPLTGAGKKWGGEKFTNERMNQALGAQGHWQNQPEVLANAKKLKDWLKDAQRRGAKVNYEKYDVFVEDPDKGCIKRKDSKSSPWEAPANKTTGKASAKPRGRR